MHGLIPILGLLLVGIVVYGIVVRAYHEVRSMRIDNRGQLTTPIWMHALVVITVGLAIVYHTIMTVPRDVSPEELENVCMGLWGCGGPNTAELTALLAAGMVLLAGFVVYATVYAGRWRSGSA